MLFYAYYVIMLFVGGADGNNNSCYSKVNMNCMDRRVWIHSNMNFNGFNSGEMRVTLTSTITNIEIPKKVRVYYYQTWCSTCISFMKYTIITHTKRKHVFCLLTYTTDWTGCSLLFLTQLQNRRKPRF